MKKLLNSFDINSFLLIIICLMPILTLYVSANPSYSKMVLIITFVLLIALYLYNYAAKASKKEILIMLINLLSILVTNSTFSALGSAITFINTILCFKIFNNIELDKKTFFKIHLVLGISLSFYVFTIQRPQYIGHRINDAFHNSVNTNIVSILFFCAFLHIICCLVQFERSKKCFIIEIILSIVYGYNIWFFGARSAIVAMAIFIISSLIIKKRVPYKPYKKIVTITLLISLLFPIIYLSFINRFSMLEFLGKGISSRRIVWQGCIDIIKSNPIFGVGNDFSIQMRASGEFTTSMHNTLLGLWKILGIIPTITFIFTCINHDNLLYDDKKDRISQLAFISTLIICFFESFYTEEMLYLAFLPFLICNIKTNIKSEVEK